MPESPSVSEVNVLPTPKDSEERDMNIAIQNYMQETNNVGEYLLRNPIKTITSDYTIEGSDFTILADDTSGTITVTLPSAVAHANEVFRVKKIANANNVTITGSENIDGTSAITLTSQYEIKKIQSDGTVWWVIGS
jgi:hypothetical protein